ncbi:MAG: hypothetical protein DI585_04230 [Pseudomonas fluorescens]|nr:MAG: hypothetical protein DI585_04230 [Pseudomonas fluorescens]
MQKHITYGLLALASILTSLPLLMEAGATVPVYVTVSLLIAGSVYLFTSSNLLSGWMQTAWPLPTLIISQILLVPANSLAITALLFLLISLCASTYTLRFVNIPWLQINRLNLVTFTSLTMWPGLHSFPSLYPAAGLLTLSLMLLFSQHRIAMPELAARIFLLGLTSVAHPVMAVLPLLTGFTLFSVWPKRALITAIAGTALTIALYSYFPSAWLLLTYQNIIESFNTGTDSLAALALLTIVIVQSIYHWRWWPPVQHAAWILGTLLFILTLSGFSEYVSTALALPLITFTLLRPTYKHR